MRQKSQEDDNAKLMAAMMTRCVPVAKAILRLIVEKDLKIGDRAIPRDGQGNVIPLAEGSRPPEYAEVAKEIQQIMLDNDLLWAERHMVFMLVRQPMDMLQNIVLTDLEATYQHGLCGLFGIEVFGELSLKMIDEFLKEQRKQQGAITSTETVTLKTELPDANNPGTK